MKQTPSLLSPWMLLPLTAARSEPAAASYLASDLCMTGGIVIIGAAVARRSYLEDLNEGGRLEQIVYTDVEFRIDRVIVGPPLLSLGLRIEGGEVGAVGQAVSGFPRLELEQPYLLYLMTVPDRDLPVFVWHSLLPNGAALPDERTLHDTWDSLCRSHPDGVYPSDARQYWAEVLASAHSRE